MLIRTGEVTQAFSYHTIRGLVGLIALLIASVAATLSGPALGSISASYHFDAQDVFVGSLFIVSAFLFAYNGSPHATKTQWIEFSSSKIASFSVFLVAIFPTECPQTLKDEMRCSVLPNYVQNVSNTLGTESSTIHAWAAAVFFLMLFVLMVVFAVRAWRKGGGGRCRAIIYGICSIGMVASLVFVMTDRNALLPEYGSVFWSEFFALMFFGMGWLYSGVYEWAGGKLRWLSMVNCPLSRD